MKDIHVIEHREFPTPDRGQRHLAERGFNVRPAAPYRGDPLPDLNGNTAGVMIMGGPGYVTHLEEFPYLVDEMDFVGRVTAKDVPLLGICLGAQVIARYMGAEVAFHPHEQVAFGYYELFPTAEGRGFLPDGLHAPAGNSQDFDVPTGATLLAQGALFPNQAYRVGDATCGLQFHPEVTRPILDLWHELLVDNFDMPGAQDRDLQNAGFERHDAALHDWYSDFLDRFFGPPGG
jgi:GMP synthase (glutamine-hydrolysing)